MWLNQRGREAHGIVAPGKEAEDLKAEICTRLRGLRDEEKGEIGINEMFDTAKLYQGPYMADAPDIIIGYNPGYRVSWDCATGVIAGPVFEDNVKAWSGDHCIDPRLVPGIFLCTKKISREDPALIDIAPTTLELFGLKPLKHMDGRPLFDEKSLADA
jgi:predicted AlkP superfamily phosphohydrolase/phosphomutase